LAGATSKKYNSKALEVYIIPPGGVERVPNKPLTVFLQLTESSAVTDSYTSAHKLVASVPKT